MLPIGFRLQSTIPLLLLLPLGLHAGFNFTISADSGLPTEDIFLQSVYIPVVDITITEFSYINSATIVQNDPITGNNTGAASADIGDNATTGVVVEDATAADIVANLTTNNLNNIIDTEDTGSFIIDLHFAVPIDNVLVFERGINSQLGVQALNDQGELIGTRLVLGTGHQSWFDTGLDIDTQEITGAQSLGALGISVLNDLNVAEGSVSALRFTSAPNYNGPDWKFVGTASDLELPPVVPEPAQMPLLFGLAALALARKR